MPTQINVIGAGVIGLATALLLQANGYQVRVVSASSPESPDGDPLYTVDT